MDQAFSSARCDWAGPLPPQTPSGVLFACLHDDEAWAVGTVFAFCQFTQSIPPT
jgi:hypothetical protein